MTKEECLQSVFTGVTEVTPSPPGLERWSQRVEFTTAACANLTGSTTLTYFSSYLLSFHSSLSPPAGCSAARGFGSRHSMKSSRELTFTISSRDSSPSTGFPAKAAACPAARAAHPAAAPPPWPLKYQFVQLN